MQAEHLCDYCGAANRVAAKFCVGCGRSLSVSGPVSTVSGQAPRGLLNQRYLLIEKIGEGGFSTVYKAQD
ncbi:MAG: hypothetical protein J2P36_23750, partial [Ktedonobacteraceae bacterium]|nr:hypothetical protein [Ktedonobacteraceae bacterium]